MFCNTLNSFSKILTSSLEGFFYSFGKIVGTHPWKFILGSLTICISFSFGLIYFHQTTDLELIWSPYESEGIKQATWIRENFPKDKRFESFIVTGDNVLSPPYIQFLYEIDQRVKSLKSEELSYDDLCFRGPSLYTGVKSECITRSLLQLWPNINNDSIYALTSEDIQDRLWSAWNTTEPFIEIRSLLSGVSIDEETRRIQAKGFLTLWIMSHNVSRNMNSFDKYHDEEGEKWERAWISLLTGALNYQPLIPSPPTTTCYSFAERSFEDELKDSVEGGFELIIPGFIMIFIFIILIFSKWSLVEQRVLLSLYGLIAISMSITSSFGLSFYLDYIYGDLHPSIPFLLLGIGVDDMFVIVQTLDTLTFDKEQSSIPEKMGHIMKHAGVSITVTSLTDITAFLISSSSSIPILRSYCTGISFGVIFLYFFVNTFFVACFTLDEHRIAERRPLVCMKPRPEKDSSIEIEKGEHEKIGEKIYKVQKYYTNYLLKTPIKIGILCLSFLSFGIGIYGVLNIEQNYDPIWYMRQNSYQVDYIKASSEYFSEQGIRVDVFIGGIPYWNNLKALDDVKSLLKNSPFIRNNSIIYWYDAVSQTCIDNKYDCSVEVKFKEALLSVLLSSDSSKNIYNNDVKLNISINLSNLNDLLNNKWEIGVTRAQFQFNSLPDSKMQVKAMDAIQNGFKEIILNESSEFSSPIPYAVLFFQWNANRTMSKELIRNLLLTLGSISIVSLLLVANLQVSAIILLSVIMTITNLIGVSYFLGLTIEIVTSLLSIILVGLVFDYSAHIGVLFACLPDDNRNVKTIKTLNQMGPAVFNGGLSTFIAISLLITSPSYVFLTFFKMFALGVLFGLFHALVFLPVVLSLVGPIVTTNEEGHTKKTTENEEKEYSQMTRL